MSQLSIIKDNYSGIVGKGAMLALTAMLTACSSNSVQTQSDDLEHRHNKQARHDHHKEDDHVKVASTRTATQINFSLFNKAAMVKDPKVVSCTLVNGDAAYCAKFVVKYLPEDLDIGPFCPSSLDREGGIWEWDGRKSGLYRVDGAFFQMLAEQGYTFYDEKGRVYITDFADKKSPHEHSCINVAVDKEVEITMLIPTEPVIADASSKLGVVDKVGMTLSGVPIFSDAPSVQQTGHIPVLDTCAGHVDPGGWYHYHGTATDMASVYEHEGVHAECHLAQDSSALFGYAFDGIGIYGSHDENGRLPTDLDTCHGHLGYVQGKQEKVYHYHATEDFPNLPPCLSGVVARNNFSTTAETGVGAVKNKGSQTMAEHPDEPDGQRRRMQGDQSEPRGEGFPPGFEEAAQTLGVSVDELFQALNDAGGPNADIGQVAKVLGISEEALTAALPQPPQR
ncbi:YHYH protein [Marinomonas sp.]